MSSKFVYVTFIKATPERVWQALTDAGFQRQYWFGVHLETDWKEGSSWKMLYEDGRVTDAGEILETQPPHRLVMKWRHQLRPELASEGDARCTYEIEGSDGVVKLTVTHETDAPNSKLIEAVSGGWPRILSNLKSLLETGKPLPDISPLRKAS